MWGLDGQYEGDIEMGKSCSIKATLHPFPDKTVSTRYEMDLSLDVVGVGKMGLGSDSVVGDF